MTPQGRTWKMWREIDSAEEAIVGWHKWDDRTVFFGPPSADEVRVGDEILSPMSSEKIGKFRVEAVRHLVDPAGYCLAKVSDQGYVELDVIEAVEAFQTHGVLKFTGGENK